MNKNALICIPPRQGGQPHKGWVPTGYGLKRFFFCTSRTPHDSKSLNGLRGRKHRQVNPSLKSRGALNGDSTMYTVTVIQTYTDKH